jgi:hypothetical protein
VLPHGSCRPPFGPELAISATRTEQDDFVLAVIVEIDQVPLPAALTVGVHAAALPADNDCDHRGQVWLAPYDGASGLFGPARDIDANFACSRRQGFKFIVLDIPSKMFDYCVSALRPRSSSPRA